MCLTSGLEAVMECGAEIVGMDDAYRKIRGDSHQLKKASISGRTDDKHSLLAVILECPVLDRVAPSVENISLGDPVFGRTPRDLHTVNISFTHKIVNGMFTATDVDAVNGSPSHSTDRPPRSQE